MFGRELKSLIIDGLLAGLVLLITYSAGFVVPPGGAEDTGLNTACPAAGTKLEPAARLSEDECDTLSSGA